MPGAMLGAFPTLFPILTTNMKDGPYPYSL